MEPNDGIAFCDGKNDETTCPLCCSLRCHCRSGRHHANAQSTFPSKPVKFIVPFPAGGINDVLARIAADKLQAKWGQPIIDRAEDRRRRQYRRRSRGAASPMLQIRCSRPRPGRLRSTRASTRSLSYKPEDACRSRCWAAFPVVAIVKKEPRFTSLKDLVENIKNNPRQGGVRQPGQRRYAASHRQHVHDHDRHQHGARALSRRDAGVRGHPRRPCRSVLRQCVGRLALCATAESRCWRCWTRRALRRCPTCRRRGGGDA